MESDFDPNDVEWKSSKLVTVKYKKGAENKTILVQIINIKLKEGGVPVTFGLEVESGTPTEEHEKKDHEKHLFKADVGGKRILIVTDKNTTAD